MTNLRPESTSKTSAQPRRWFRFSLRTFLVVTTVICVWWAIVYNRVQSEQRAAAAIQAASGRIVYDWQIRAQDSDPKEELKPPGPQWLRELLGPHWFDTIVEVSINTGGNSHSSNRFALVGPHLVGLPELRLLSLRGEQRDDADYRVLGRLTQLEELSLTHRSEISPRQLADLAGIKGLRELSIEAPISARALRELEKFPDLETLEWKFQFSDRSSGRQPREYWLRDDGAEAIANLKQVRSLALSNTLFTDKGMAALSQMNQLEKLRVSSHQVTGASLQHVVKLKNLESLGTWAWQLRDEDLSVLKRLPKLRTLDLLTSGKLTDKGLTHLAAFHDLTFLRLSGAEITDASVHHLHALTNLEHLDLDGTSVAKYGAAATQLQQALPACVIRLPRTVSETQAKRAFLNWKWGGQPPPRRSSSAQQVKDLPMEVKQSE